MSNVHEYIDAANRPLTDPQIHHRIKDPPHRFELYHFALSLCSQKVRSCLIEKGAPFLSHDINVQLPLLGNYDPAYVRLRLLGRGDRPFVHDFAGRSSTESEGFDPAVVPTLVDIDEERVCVDSVRICTYIDRAWTEGVELIPAARASAIQAEIEVVDATPHVAILYGAHPDVDFRPERLKKGMPGVHDRKIDKIKQARTLADGDSDLVAAFDAKIHKEEAARAFVATPDRMRQAVSEVLHTVAGLEERLAGEYICGPSLTLADLFWAVSLFRLQWLGMAFAWRGHHALNATERPNVQAYAERLFSRPQFRAAVIDWPRTPRTKFVSEYYPDTTTT